MSLIDKIPSCLLITFHHPNPLPFFAKYSLIQHAYMYVYMWNFIKNEGGDNRGIKTLKIESLYLFIYSTKIINSVLIFFLTWVQRIQSKRHPQTLITTFLYIEFPHNLWTFTDVATYMLWESRYNIPNAWDTLWCTILHLTLT